MIDLPTRLDITTLVTTLAFVIFVGYWTGVLTGSWDRRDMPPRFVPIQDLLRDQPGDTRDIKVRLFYGSFVEVAERPRWTEVRL